VKKHSNSSTADTGFQPLIEAELLKLYGPVLTSQEISKILGFSTVHALRQAVLKGRLEIPLFRMAGKRGRFALTKEIASYVVSQRMALETSDGKKTHGVNE